MRRLLPQSLFGQTLLILLAGLLASHLIGTWIYSADRGQIVRAVGGFAIAQRITNLTRLVRDAPIEWQARIVMDSSDETFNVVLSPEPPSAALTDNDTPAAEALKQLLIEQLSLDGTSQPVVSASLPRGMMAGMAERMMPQDSMMHGMARRMMGESQTMRGFAGLGPFAGFRELQVAIPMRQGQWLTFTTILPESGAAFSLRFLVSMGIMAVIAILVSIWVVRRVSSPLTALSKAALRLGEDLNAPPMPEVGTVETRQAAHAFNAMQARLRGMIDDRTKMLAAISHDFRTPLTLLRLRVENVEDTVEREKMLSTIAELNKMVATTLEFASGVTKQPVRRPTDLAALTESIVDDLADAGLPVQMGAAAQPIIYACDPATLKRALTNLIDNAVKYGGHAEVAIHKTSQKIEITIDDGGPGIPEEELTHVLEPLYRLESSRSRETGGMGLGLAITLSIIRAHGGQLILSNRVEGGLRALIYFPVNSN